MELNRQISTCGCSDFAIGWMHSQGGQKCLPAHSFGPQAGPTVCPGCIPAPLQQAAAPPPGSDFEDNGGRGGSTERSITPRPKVEKQMEDEECKLKRTYDSENANK